MAKVLKSGTTVVSEPRGEVVNLFRDPEMVETGDVQAQYRIQDIFIVLQSLPAQAANVLLREVVAPLGADQQLQYR